MQQQNTPDRKSPGSEQEPIIKVRGVVNAFGDKIIHDHVDLDVRRGDGPKACFNYTMASVATSDRVIERSPGVPAATVRAMAKTHAALKKDLTLATTIGRKLFPPTEAELISVWIGMSAMSRPSSSPFRMMSWKIATSFSSAVLPRGTVNGSSAMARTTSSRSICRSRRRWKANWPSPA